MILKFVQSPTRPALFLGAALLVVASSAGLMAQMKTTTTPAQSADARIVQLEQRIRDLEARVKALEDEGDFPQDDTAGGTPPSGRDTGGGTVGRGGQPSGGAAGSTARPTRVKAPFEIIDGDGKVLLRVERGTAGGGVVTALTSNGGVASQFGVGSTGFAGSVRLHKDGKELVAIGVASDEGAIRLNDAAGRNRLALGAEVNGGGVAMYDTSGHERVRLGFADGNRGYVAVRNDKGAEVAHLFESAAGVGNLVTRDADGQGVQIGTKTRASGAFGDVCATSPKGGMCLSVLAIKAMSPY
jgi:hypothetical protein